jgi:hypothetical protein
MRPRAPVGGEGTGFWHLPPRAFLIALVTRAVTIWAGMRVLLALGIALLDAGPPLRLPASTASLLALLAGTLGLVELRRRREHLLLGNLGVGQSVLFLTGLVPAAFLESLLLLARHVSP